MFEKLQKPSYPELIVDKIRDLIVEREFGQGDRLPSERELAEQFGVSRASIREATSALTALGLVEARTGDGTYIKTNLTESILQPLSWAVVLAGGVGQDLVEARKIIEPGIAALAAERATESDKEKLYETVKSMEKAVGNPVKFAEQDLQFHMSIAEAAHNQILLETMNGFQRLLQSLIASHVLDTEQQASTLQEHIEIYEAVKCGDAARAERWMLDSCNKDLLRDSADGN
jgi:DNA-binding FadR family transcriptional regulator